MKNFPTLTTSKKNFILKPLQKRHIPFLVELLNSPTIQKTLFRVPTKITEEKEAHALERMYESEKPKEIVYILTLKSLLKETPFGYVKIKLIDWSVKSCFLSVAIFDSPSYRGQGYAKAAYESFFDYLFSIGILKIYGRTYESNIPTIKLNEATGFRFIGRQKNFIIYPDKTALDALLFEKTAATMDMTYKKPHDLVLQELYRALKPFAEKRNQGTVTTADHTFAINTLKSFEKKPLPTDWQEFITYTRKSLESETVLNIDLISEDKKSTTDDPQFFYSDITKQLESAISSIFPTITVVASKSHAAIEYNRYSGTVFVPTHGNISVSNLRDKGAEIGIKIARTLNPYILGIHLGSLLLTNDSVSRENRIIRTFLDITTTNQKPLDSSDLFCAGDQEVIQILRFQFLGQHLPYDYLDVMNLLKHIEAIGKI